MIHFSLLSTCSAVQLNRSVLGHFQSRYRYTARVGSFTGAYNTLFSCSTSMAQGCTACWPLQKRQSRRSLPSSRHHPGRSHSGPTAKRCLLPPPMVVPRNILAPVLFAYSRIRPLYWFLIPSQIAVFCRNPSGSCIYPSESESDTGIAPVQQFFAGILRHVSRPRNQTASLNIDTTSLQHL